MFVAVEKYVKTALKTYGFTRILEDFDLDHSRVLQILEDHGYINLDSYREECQDEF